MSKKKTIIEKDDILVASGGWECTFPTFYKVLDVKNGYVTIQQLCKETTSFEPYAGTKGSGTQMPINIFSDIKPIRRKIVQSDYDDEQYVVIQKSYYLSAHIWDGKPKVFDYRNL